VFDLTFWLGRSTASCTQCFVHGLCQPSSWPACTLSTYAHGSVDWPVDRYFGQLFLFGPSADQQVDRSLVRTYYIFWPIAKSTYDLQWLVLTSYLSTFRSTDALSLLQ